MHGMNPRGAQQISDAKRFSKTIVNLIAEQLPSINREVGSSWGGRCHGSDNLQNQASHSQQRLNLAVTILSKELQHLPQHLVSVPVKHRDPRMPCIESKNWDSSSRVKNLLAADPSHRRLTLAGQRGRTPKED